MDIQISGVHLEVGDALRAHCKEQAQSLDALFPQIEDVRVNLHQCDRFKNHADVMLRGHGLSLRAVGEGEDFYLAVSNAVAKVARQLDKYKGRLQKHRRRRHEDGSLAEALRQAKKTEAVHSRIEESSLDEAPEDIFKEFMPKIVHKDVREIQTLTVDEAVMQMDLLHAPFFIFQNPTTQAVNVVYREAEGVVNWVEPRA